MTHDDRGVQIAFKAQVYAKCRETWSRHSLHRSFLVITNPSPAVVCGSRMACRLRLGACARCTPCSAESFCGKAVGSSHPLQTALPVLDCRFCRMLWCGGVRFSPGAPWPCKAYYIDYGHAYGQVGHV